MNEANVERQIILDTETTGMNVDGGPHYIGHRVIEIGCVEMMNRKLTGRTFHKYLNPEQEIDAEAIAVHGITNDQVADKPVFAEICDDLIQFIDGSELIAHNASFDTQFLDYELEKMGHHYRLENQNKVTDTLAMAKKRFPGQKNNLDALCRRFDIDNAHRTLHGALLDAEILADVYLLMTGGQTELNLSASLDGLSETDKRSVQSTHAFKVIQATADELEEHSKALRRLQSSLWPIV